MKKVKFFWIFSLLFFASLVVGCSNNTISEIDLFVDEVYATSVSFKDDNPEFLYKDKLTVELYKNNELVKVIDNYKKIEDLEPDTDYILKYQYNNGNEEINKELSFKTNKLEEINLYIDEVTFDSVSLSSDNPTFNFNDTMIIKLYQGDEFISEIHDLNNISDLIINTSYRIEYQYFNGNENVSKELLFNTLNHQVLSENNSFIANFYNISHIKVTVNDTVILDRDTTSEENEFKFENLNISDSIKIVVTSTDANYRPMNYLYDINLSYSQYFIDTFKFNNGYIGLNDPNTSELVFENYVVIDGKMIFIGEIEDETFMNNDKIESITFNDSFEIGKKAFYNCDNLKTLILKGDIEIGTESFANCNSLEEIDFRNCSFKVLTEEIIKMQGYDTGTNTNRSFAECENLTTVYLAVNQPLIKGMFEGCTNLTKVVNIGTIKLFPSNVFKDCVNLENVTINSECVVINSLSFENCNKIKELFIGKNCILKICAFQGCDNLVVKTDASSRPEKWYDDFCEETCEIIYNQTR